MIGATRLGQPFGMAIDRTRPLKFTFEGKSFAGYAGDTVASALVANGVWLIGRSFKYHRPRSILSLDGSDTNLFVTIGGIPNQPAEQTLVSEGMTIEGQNYKGSLARDRWALTGFLSRFLPVGFYYWSFYRPRGAWRFWEKVIRARAGLGRIDPDHQWRKRSKTYGWADIVVIGAGPEGQAAARTAASTGAEVLLLDGDAAKRMAPIDGVRFEPNTVVHGIYADGWMAASREGQLWKVRAKQIVLTTGTLKQPAVFRNNDRPGIMLGASAVRLIHDFGVRPGRLAVVITAGSDGYAVAGMLLDCGLNAVTIVDRRLRPGPEAAEAAGRGMLVLTGYEPNEAIGRLHVKALKVRPVGEIAPGRTIECDLVCLCCGGVPDASLWCHAGGVLEYDRGNRRWRLRGKLEHMLAAGCVLGHTDMADRIVDGEAAGRLAALRAGFGGRSQRPRRKPPAGVVIDPIIVPHSRGKEFVDFDEDLTVKDIRVGVAQGFDHVQLLKRYSTLGMGPSQGRHALAAATEIIAQARADPSEAVATTTFRPPLHGLSFAALAGQAFHPERLSPMDSWHRAAGAEMMVAGTWWRPAYYPAQAIGDARAIALDEARWVRSDVGLIDVSTLGKIEIRGPDAAAFLDRFYTFRFANQPIGRLRYALATDETGAIIDDGIACRLAEDHLYVTTTTGASDQIFRSMLWWNIFWGLDVDITNVTGAYAAINLAGPLSRRVLRRITDMDLEAEAFPYLAARTGKIAGVPVRVMRGGFVGELAYEIHVPAGYGLHLWTALIQAGSAEEIRPFGVEAQRLLRLEKGHIIVGQDADALSFPREVGMGWAVADKADFVGKRSIDIHNRRGLGRVLVGYRLPTGAPTPEEGHLTLRDGGAIAGRVTSSGLDTRSGAPIGLAYVHPDQSDPGSSFVIKAAGGRRLTACVVALPFYDPDNARQEIDP